jgi:hypothetical protein
MHTAVKRFIKQVRKEFPYKFRNKRVLEVGSHNINGSPRKYFWFGTYTGVDITKGNGVDIRGVFSQVRHMLRDDYQTVISTEMLEHDSAWKESLLLMYKLLEDKGLLIITCAGPHREEHGTARAHRYCSPDTSNYYRNISVEDFESVLPPELFSVYRLQYANGKEDLQFYGLKKERKRF